MKLNAPKFITWVIALVLGALALLSHFVTIPFISVYFCWIILIALILLLLGCVIKGL